MTARLDRRGHSGTAPAAVGLTTSAIRHCAMCFVREDAKEDEGESEDRPRIDLWLEISRGGVELAALFQNLCSVHVLLQA